MIVSRVRDPEAHAVSDPAARLRPRPVGEGGVRRDPRRDPDHPVHALRRAQHEADPDQDRARAQALALADGALDPVSGGDPRDLHRAARRVRADADRLAARRDVRVAARPGLPADERHRPAQRRAHHVGDARHRRVRRRGEHASCCTSTIGCIGAYSVLHEGHCPSGTRHLPVHRHRGLDAAFPAAPRRDEGARSRAITRCWPTRSTRTAAACFTSSATASARCSRPPATRSPPRSLRSARCTASLGRDRRRCACAWGCTRAPRRRGTASTSSSLTLARTQRVAAAGHGGQTLLSAAAAERVRDALPAGTTLRDLGAHKLRGITEPETIFQLVAADLPSAFPPLRGRGRRRRRRPAPLHELVRGQLVGRAAEAQTAAAALGRRRSRRAASSSCCRASRAWARRVWRRT